MNEEIKIIDLLNKIANCEQVPKKIRFNEDIYTYHSKEHGYCKPHYDNTYICLNSEYYLFDILNKKVEIIEEDKKIEKIKIDKNNITVKGTTFFREKDIEIFQKLSMEINELIDEVNKLKENNEN